jgi:hypothetical protein
MSRTSNRSICLQDFLLKFCMHFSCLAYMPHTSNHIQLTVQIMKLLIIHFSLLYCHCLLLSPKCHPQHSVVIKFLQSVFFRKQQRPSFTPEQYELQGAINIIYRHYKPGKGEACFEILYMRVSSI